MSAGGTWPEEDWEAAVARALSSLPPVDPPQGFLRRAMDHRPKYAARLSAASMALVLASAGAVVALGLVGDPTPVDPAVPALRERHVRVAAGPGSGGGSGDTTFEPVDESGAVVTLPAEFEPKGRLADDQLSQVLYDHHGQVVSVFVQPGTVSWDDLPAEGILERDGRRVWIDRPNRIVVLEVSSHVVAVVGLDPDRVVALLHDEPRGEVTAGDRLRALAREVSRQAGFP